MFDRFRLIVPALALVALGCDDGDDKTTEIPPVTAEALAQYADIVHASYVDSRAAAEALDTAIEAFNAAPSAATLDAARQAWLDAREPYLQTEVYRFYDGPIDNPTDGPEGLINAWPLDESYIDGIIAAGTAGISAEQLEAANEQGGEENIATGFHAIEYLLWGADTSPDGPGDRPASDFVDGEAEGAEARRLYLATTSDMLLDHLDGLVAAWAPDDAQNYRAAFLAAPPEEGLRRVMTGMIVLAGFETGGERLQAALDSGDQEDEHSCFSDNTHRDMIQDVRGIRNVWRGVYTRTAGGPLSGAGVEVVVEAADPALASRISQQIDESLALAEALPVPFDRAIATDNDEGRAAVEALILSLRDLESMLQDAFALFELQVPSVE